MQIYFMVNVTSVFAIYNIRTVSADDDFAKIYRNSPTIILLCLPEQFTTLQFQFTFEYTNTTNDSIYYVINVFVHLNIVRKDIEYHVFEKGIIAIRGMPCQMYIVNVIKEGIHVFHVYL